MLPKRVDLCQIREEPRFHLNDDGTTSLFFWEAPSFETRTEPLLGMCICFRFVTLQKNQNCYQHFRIGFR